TDADAWGRPLDETVALILPITWTYARAGLNRRWATGGSPRVLRLAFWMQTTGACQVRMTSAGNQWCVRSCMRAVVRPRCCTFCCTDLTVTCQGNSGHIPASYDAAGRTRSDMPVRQGTARIGCMKFTLDHNCLIAIEQQEQP